MAAQPPFGLCIGACCETWSSFCRSGYGGGKGGMMRRSAGLLLGYFLVKVLVCNAEGEPGQKPDDSITVNDSKDGESGMSAASDSPHKDGRCSGYYDVMGQWDPPFNCTTGSYLYCCGTCGFRFCCEYKASRLDQNTCKNYDTPQWLMTGKPPPKRNDPTHDPTKDKTNLIVYIVCGVVAIMALVGIFTKLGLEKAHRPHRDNMSRALAHVMRQPAPGAPSQGPGGQRQHYDNMHVSRPTLTSHQMNSVVPGSAMMAGVTQPYPAPGQLTHPYDQHTPRKEISKYASLKAVAEKANDGFYAGRRHAAGERTPQGGPRPLQPAPVDPEPPSNPYSPPPPQPSLKQNGHKSQSGGQPYSSHTLAYGSSAAVSPPPGALKGWEGTETVGRRQSYGPPKRHIALGRVSDQHPLHSQHYLPPQPYFITNSKTEVTV